MGRPGSEWLEKWRLGTPEYVVAHGRFQYLQGKHPSATLPDIANPRDALTEAKRYVTWVRRQAWRKIQIDAAGSDPLTQEDYKQALKHDRGAADKFDRRRDGGRREWICVCGAIAKVTVIAHPIWDGPFDGAGSGMCDYRRIPYCAFCDGARPPGSAAARSVSQ